MTATRPQPRPGVLDIAPYVPGKSSAPGVAKVFKLSSNETPLGPSPRAIAAYQAAALILRTIRTARPAICAKRSAAPSGSIPTASSAAPAPTICCICLAHAYLSRRRRGDPHHARLSDLSDRDARHRREAGGGAGDRLHRRRRRHPRAVTSKTKIVFLANPNNPTGTCLPFDEVKRLHRGLPPHVLLVLDAAYAEYVRRNDYEAGIELVATSENVVMTAHVFENPRARGVAARLDVRPGAHRRRGQPHSRPVQRQRRRRSPPASPRSRMSRTRNARASTTRAGSTG